VVPGATGIAVLSRGPLAYQPVPKQVAREQPVTNNLLSGLNAAPKSHYLDV